MGLPVDTVSLEGENFRIDFGSIGARYEGKLNKDATEITGTWTQGPGPTPLTFTRIPEKAGAEGKQGKRAMTDARAGGGGFPQGGPDTGAGAEDSKLVASDPIKALWAGALDAGGVTLRMIVHLSRSADGKLSATMDSPAQGATGIPFRLGGPQKPKGHSP